MSHPRSFARGAVATPHYLESLAGARVLADGGNAVDAIIAANLALGVVAPYYCGYGGDLLAMVWDGALRGYRSTGRSPAAATIGVVRERTGSAVMPTLGPHTVTVPGAVRGWFDLLERWGTRSFGDLASDAIRCAEDGFVLSTPGAYRLAGSVAMPRALGVDDTDLRAAYPDVRPGVLLRQAPLGRTIRILAADGPDAYYRGPIAAAIAAAVQSHGGVMTPNDLAAHESAWLDPLLGGFADSVVAQLPPPTQGVTVLQMLGMAAGFDLGADDVDRAHLLIKIAKLGLADRDAYISDPEAMPVDAARLIDDEWIAARRATIDPKRARPQAVRPTVYGDTAYLCCADADGLLVSLIQSNFTNIGSGVHAADWGINLHNRGSSFSLDADHVNALAPSKLPMHTLIPAMVLRDGRPTHVYGTMGGHAQAQVHLQLLVRILLDGENPQAAIDAPRWEVDPDTAVVSAEARIPEEWFDDLAGRGHTLGVLRNFDDAVGHAHAIEVSNHGYRVSSDPRCEGAALGI